LAYNINLKHAQTGLSAPQFYSAHCCGDLLSVASNCYAGSAQQTN
jgi:hypothetical protein